MNKQEYYKAIAEHYNREADSYEERQQPNKTLHKIRNDFRQVVIDYIKGQNIMDFGCGTGSDICFFAAKYGEKSFTGIDLSAEMIEKARDKAEQQNLSNIALRIGSLQKMPDQKYDFIYTFFGVLNTVHDLDETASDLYDCLNDNGRIVLTFVNKWYPMGMLGYLRRLKFKKAFERLKTTWGGYSEKQQLTSRTWYGNDIIKRFKKFKLLYKRGYSIVYPAWYQDRIAQELGSLAEKLWGLDIYLSKTPFWSWGEYVLLVFEKKTG